MRSSNIKKREGSKTVSELDELLNFEKEPFKRERQPTFGTNTRSTMQPRTATPKNGGVDATKKTKKSVEKKSRNTFVPSSNKNKMMLSQDAAQSVAVSNGQELKLQNNGLLLSKE